jgi:hypothetical protein
MKIILFLLLPISVSAQSVGVGHSVKFWGQTESMIDVNVAYDDFTLHYFHPLIDDYYIVEKNNTLLRSGNLNNSFALSWNPLKYKFISSGVMISNNKYPVEKGSHVNFIISIEIPIKMFSVSYKHISNGFGIQNPINIGVDFLSVKYSLWCC